MLIDWDYLPENMKNDEVKKYYEILNRKRCSLRLKRVFDIAVSAILLVILMPIFIIVAALIKIDSPGPVFFRQTRVTQYGKKFRIFKFRTMYVDAEKKGPLVTQRSDSRITKTGEVIRKYRLDEIPQLLDIFRGTMTFVGTRPEVPKYVEQYSPEMMATLLLPAGVTSEASIKFKDENLILQGADDVDAQYLNDVLPIKMAYNLQALREFSLLHEFSVMIKTVFAVLK